MSSGTICLKGYLACQYSIPDSGNVGKSSTYAQQGSLRLEPRFHLYEAEEVPVDSYPEVPSADYPRHITQRGEQEVEVYFKGSDTSHSGSRRLLASEILLLPTRDESPHEDGDPFNQTRPFQQYLSENPRFSGYHQPFMAVKGREVHGRMIAPAYLRVIPEAREMVTQAPVVDTKSPLVIHAGPTGSVTVHGDAGMSRGGGGVTASPLGCVGLLASAGRGFGGFGCGLPLGLLLGIGLLALFLNRQSCNSQSTQPPIIIHDTVVVEVRKKDTLTIVRTDTLKMIDTSLVTTQYETLNLSNVQFYTNSDILLPSSAEELQQLAEFLIKNDTLSATIYGHTDSIGKPRDNLVLSQRRAESVKKFLQSLGVDGERLNPVGMGSEQPMADNATEEGRLMNRRVEVKLTQRTTTSKKVMSREELKKTREPDGKEHP